MPGCPKLELGIAEPWYSKIVIDRTKPVEGRKDSPDTWGTLRAGDVVVLRDDTPPPPGAAAAPRSCLAVVTHINRYPPGPGALRRYLEGETLGRALPGVATMEEGEKVYLQWSTAAEIDARGMLAIGLRPLNA